MQKTPYRFFVHSVCFLLLNADMWFLAAIFFIKHRQKLVGGQFSCFWDFCRKKIQVFLDTPNRERDFWGDVWNLGLSSLGDVCNQKKVKASWSADLWNPWKKISSLVTSETEKKIVLEIFLMFWRRILSLLLNFLVTSCCAGWVGFSDSWLVSLEIGLIL